MRIRFTKIGELTCSESGFEATAVKLTVNAGDNRWVAVEKLSNDSTKLGGIMAEHTHLQDCITSLHNELESAKATNVLLNLDLAEVDRLVNAIQKEADDSQEVIDKLRMELCDVKVQSADKIQALQRVIDRQSEMIAMMRDESGDKECENAKLRKTITDSGSAVVMCHGLASKLANLDKRVSTYLDDAMMCGDCGCITVKPVYTMGDVCCPHCATLPADKHREMIEVISEHGIGNIPRFKKTAYGHD